MWKQEIAFDVEPQRERAAQLLWLVIIHSLCFCLNLHSSIGEDPETRRLRTVKNIADLRQNLEETMSSLRGTQVSHR